MTPEQRYLQYKTAFESVTLPAAWLDLDLLDTNIRAIAARANGRSVRVVSKSIRSRAVLNYLLQNSSLFQGVMCYHPAEAAWLASTGMDDLLVAYPSVCRQGIDAVCRQVAEGKKIYLMIDCEQHAMLIHEQAQKHGVTVPVCLDVDMSVDFPGLYFGVYRSPIRSAEDAKRLYRKINTLSGIRLCAVMGYEAQIAGATDNAPGQWLENTVVPKLKARSIPIIHKRRQAVVAALREMGADIRLVNGGGTGSIESTLQDSSVTEVAVGSGFYSPRLFDCYQNFRHEPAAGFATPVTRQPRKGMYTSFSGGYVASGSISDIKAPCPHLPAGITLIKNEGCGEVQTPFKLARPALDIGAPVFWRHAKAGELCERFDTLYGLRGSRLSETFPTYRGEGKNFA